MTASWAVVDRTKTPSRPPPSPDCCGHSRNSCRSTWWKHFSGDLDLPKKGFYDEIMPSWGKIWQSTNLFPRCSWHPGQGPGKALPDGLLHHDHPRHLLVASHRSLLLSCDWLTDSLDSLTDCSMTAQSAALTSHVPDHLQPASILSTLESFSTNQISTILLSLFPEIRISDNQKDPW